jgi:hypothetical protein
MNSDTSANRTAYPQRTEADQPRSKDVQEALADISDKLRRLNKKAAKYPDLAMLSYFIEMAYMESCTYNESAHGKGE